MGPSSRFLPALPFATAAIVIAFGCLLLIFHQSDRAAQRVADRARIGGDLLNQSYSALRDAENAQRGFVLTRDSSFLIEHDSATAMLATTMDSLRKLATTPADTQLVATVDSIARHRLLLTRRVIALVQSNAIDSARMILASGEGPRVMADFRRHLSDVSTWMRSFQHRREAEYARRSAFLAWAIGIGALFAAAAAYATSVALLRYGRTRERDAATLAAANEQLTDQAAELEMQAVELEESLTSQQESARLFRALARHATDVVFIVDVDGNITYASESAERILGYTPAQMTGSSLSSYAHPDDASVAATVIMDSVKTPDQRVTGECRLQDADGGWRLFEIIACNVLEDKAVNGIVLTCHDITEERVAQTRLRQSQKMEAVGRLAGGIAHDFNNLLTAIIGNAQLALDDAEERTEIHTYVDEVLRAGQIASSLTRQLLAFSRQQLLRPEVVNLNDFLDDSLALMRRLVGADIEIKTNLSSDIAAVHADTGQLHQVVMNLIVNARDAMPNGGTITIETSNAELGPEQTQWRGHPVIPGPYVVLSVRDTGEGMSADVRERVFEPFYTTKDQGKGTGLGLSTTYGIVKQSGGHIWVYSEPGSGTIFKIYLPAVSEQGERRTMPSRPAPERVSGDMILVVEDEDAVRSYARKVLERAGYSVIDARDAEEALRLIDEHVSRISLVMTDVIMPGMSGKQLASATREKHGPIRFLYTSGYPQSEMSENGRLPADVDFIEKPYTPAQLVECVSETLS